MTTIEFLNSYSGHGAAELRAAIASINDPNGKVQRAAYAIAGQTYAGSHDIVAVFAQWVADEICGESARDVTRVIL